MESNRRLNCIPILHVKGSYFTIGFSIGRTFKSMIQDLLSSWSYFNDELWPSYNTEEGKTIFENCLDHCKIKFPNYIDEIKGMAEGSGVPFNKLFLLNIDSLITSNDRALEIESLKVGCGCTSIICNQNEVLLGHTEDAMCEILNNVYIISAEIVDDYGQCLEKFTSFSYAGHLMGYTMGYNDHGMVYSVNTLFPVVNKSGTPRAFIARAILNSRNLEELLFILRDSGCGIADGFSLNVYFAGDTNKTTNEEVSRSFYNIEILPKPEEVDYEDVNSSESLLDVLTVGHYESYIHSNRYLRMKTKEPSMPIRVSTCRHKTIEKFSEPKNLSDIKCILSDQSDCDFPIFVCDDIICSQMPHIKTVAVGIFNVTEKTWSIFVDKPTESEPIVVLPLNF